MCEFHCTTFHVKQRSQVVSKWLVGLRTGMGPLARINRRIISVCCGCFSAPEAVAPTQPGADEEAMPKAQGTQVKS